MFSSSSRAWFGGSPEVGRERGADADWEVLDRFVQSLADADRSYNLRKVALRAICEATGATVALLFRSATGRAVEIAGEREYLTLDWPALARQLLLEAPSGGLTSSRTSFRSSRRLGRMPVHAALVRVDRDHSDWVIAASYDPEAKLRPSDLKVITVIWRLQANQSRRLDFQGHLKRTLFDTVRCLAAAVDARLDRSTGWSEYVARLAAAISRRLDLPGHEVSNVYLAGLLRDVGCLSLPEALFRRIGPLTSEERELLQRHPILSTDALAPAQSLAYLLPAVRAHHERPDGTGYPDGLTGDAIPLAARILALAESCGEFLHPPGPDRPRNHSEIEAALHQGAGRQWDARIVQTLLSRPDDFASLLRQPASMNTPAALDS